MRVKVAVLAWIALWAFAGLAINQAQYSWDRGPQAVGDPVVGAVPWWNDVVFYEVFVRSFQDSDGDGDRGPAWVDQQAGLPQRR